MRLSFLKNNILNYDIIHQYIPISFNQTNYNENINEITWITNSYVNNSIGGSEYMCHTINKFLIEKGFKINIIGNWLTEIYDGVHLINIKDVNLVQKTIGSSKFLFSQNYSFPEITVRIGDMLDKKVFIFIHTTLPLCDPSPQKYVHLMKNKQNMYFIFNSKWIYDIYLSLNLNSLIIIPPIRCTTKTTSNTHEYITLVNISEDKGGRHLIDIANSLPQYKFLGVGNYGIKDTRVRNITYIPYTNNINDVYSKTDIILMPSIYESWGMVASESIYNGIPVIASNTPGLKENLDSAGIFVDRDSIAGWVHAINELKVNRLLYEEVSANAAMRSIALLERFNSQIQRLCNHIQVD